MVNGDLVPNVLVILFQILQLLYQRFAAKWNAFCRKMESELAQDALTGYD